MGAAPLTGRVALPCWSDGVLEMKSWVFCVTNRNFMDPDLIAALQDSAEDLDAAFPGTVTQVLDANFPFFNGFPLLPHLSHDDGEKVDLAFFYQADGGPLGTRTRSPVGYFAFEDGPTQCPMVWRTLRWNLRWLRPLWPGWSLDESRTSYLIRSLTRDDRISKVFVEPHLKDRLRLTSPKIRFQGCRAARHDDHIHVQL
jgi:murein endopeptidase